MIRFGPESGPGVGVRFRVCPMYPSAAQRGAVPGGGPEMDRGVRRAAGGSSHCFRFGGDDDDGKFNASVRESPATVALPPVRPPPSVRVLFRVRGSI